MIMTESMLGCSDASVTGIVTCWSRYMGSADDDTIPTVETGVSEIYVADYVDNPSRPLDERRGL